MGSFRKEILGQEMSTMLLHHKIQEGQLADERPLVVPEIAPLSTMVQSKWPLDNSIQNLPSSFLELKLARLLREKGGDIEKHYIDAVEVMSMLFLVVEEKKSTPANAMVEGSNTRRSSFNSVPDEDLSTENASFWDININNVASWRDNDVDWTSSSALLLLYTVVNHNQIPPLGFGVVIAKDHMLGKRVDVRDALAITSLPAELQRTSTLGSRKGYLGVYIIEISHGLHGYYKLRNSIYILPGICRMCVVSAGNGSATNVSLLSQPKSGPLPKPSSFRTATLPELDLQFSASSLNASNTVDSPLEIARPQIDACSKCSVQIQENDENRSNTGHMGDACRTRYQKVPIFIAHCSGEVLLTVDLDKSSEHMMHLFEEKTKMKLVHQYFKLPTLDGYFSANKSKLLKVFKLPDGRKSLAMTKKGCRVLSSWLKCFTETLSKGKSWAGLFTLKYFTVTHDHVQVITEAKLNLVGNHLKADLTELARLIKQYFSSNEGGLVSRFPPYLDNLIRFLESRSFQILLPIEKMFIEMHISCMECPDRGMLLLLLKKKYRSLNNNMRNKWDNAINDGEWAASNVNIESPCDLSKVVMFDGIIDKASRDGKAYALSKANTFRLMRDGFSHGPEHRFDKSVEPWAEKFKNDDAIELMIPAFLDDSLAHVILSLMKSNFDITQELLACKVQCFCHICQVPPNKKEAAGAKPSDDKDATSSRPSCDKELTGSKATGSGPSDQAESSMKRGNVSFPSLFKNEAQALASLKQPSSQPSKPKPPPPEDDGSPNVRSRKGNRR